MEMSSFSVDLVQTDGEAVVRFIGDLDSCQAVDAERFVRSRLPDLDGRPLVLDLSDLRFCDSSGIRCLLHLQDAAAAERRSMVLRRPGPMVLRVLEILGLTEQFPIEQDGDGHHR